MQVLTGHCNLQRRKKTTGRAEAESFLCPKYSVEDETPNYHVGNRKLYQDIRVKYFGIAKTTVHDVVTGPARGGVQRVHRTRTRAQGARMSSGFRVKFWYCTITP